VRGYFSQFCGPLTLALPRGIDRTSDNVLARGRGENETPNCVSSNNAA
jgi:hypothetical protein